MWALRLGKSHPETSFIFIYHTTKQGRFKGVNTHAHEVDVIIEVGNGEAKATGRFNAGGRMNLAEDCSGLKDKSNPLKSIILTASN
jgi:hypothetical protein